MVHYCQTLIKVDKCGDSKCFRDERTMVEESTLLTTAVRPQPVRMILLFSARLAVPIRRKNIALVWKSGANSRVAVSSVGNGQLTSLVQKEHRGY